MNKKNTLSEECEKSISFFTNHLETLRRQIGIIEESKRLLKNADSKTDLKDFIEMENLNNYNGYITISNLDLAVNLKNLIKAQTDWEKIFFIKNSYLIIHETLNKLNPPKKKNYLEKSILESYPGLRKDYEDLLSDIIKFKATPEYKKIEKVRHQTAGHIVDSLKRYYDTVRGLNGEIAGQNIIEFMRISRKALNLTKDYAVLSNDKSLKEGKVLEKQLIEKLEKLKTLFKT